MIKLNIRKHSIRVSTVSTITKQLVDINTGSELVCGMERIGADAKKYYIVAMHSKENLVSLQEFGSWKGPIRKHPHWIGATFK